MLTMETGDYLKGKMLAWFSCASSKEQALQSPGNWLGIPSVCIFKYAISSKGFKNEAAPIPLLTPQHMVFRSLMRTTTLKHWYLKGHKYSH